jgi:hypothetical protein
MLLLSHANAVNSSPTIPAEHWDVSWLPNLDLYTWMTTDEPPPECLSVWLSRVRPSVPARRDKSAMFLPTVVAEGRSARFMVRRQILRTWEITLLCHPGWPVTYPLETIGESVRVWPSSGRPVDLSTMPIVEQFAVQWLAGPELWSAPGTYQPKLLPPLTDAFPGHSIPGVVYARL